jgi:cytochrome c peroxidase
MKTTTHRNLVDLGQYLIVVVTVAALALLLNAFANGQEMPRIQQPAGAINTPEAVALGKGCFFSTWTSTTGQKSCASCHEPERAWTNNRPVSQGVNGAEGIRTSVSIVDACLDRAQFRDGRADFLEEQALQPIKAAAELGQQTPEQMCARMNQVKYFHDAFIAVFGEPRNRNENPVTPDRFARVVAAFERTILHGEAPIDRRNAGEKHVWDKDTEHGYLVFGSSGCTECHVGAAFSDGKFHDILGATRDRNGQRDRGRQNATKDAADRDLFKTPRLRDVQDRAPYGHSGNFDTMAAMIHYLGNPTVEIQDDGTNRIEVTRQDWNEYDEACLTLFMLTAFKSYNPPIVKAPDDLPVDPRSTQAQVVQNDNQGQGRGRRGRR